MKRIILIAALLFPLFHSDTVFAGSVWINEYDTWRYYKDNGMPERTEGWKDKDGKKSYIDRNGCALSGWQVITERDESRNPIDKHYSYFEENTGTALTGTQYIDGFPYTFDPEGKLISEPLELWGLKHRDLKTINDGWYVIRHNGKKLLSVDKFYIKKAGFMQYKIYSEEGKALENSSDNLKISTVRDSDDFLWFITKTTDGYSLVSKVNGFTINDGSSLGAATNNYHQVLSLTKTTGDEIMKGDTDRAAERSNTGERQGKNIFTLKKAGGKYQLTDPSGRVIQEGSDIFISTFFSTNAYTGQHRMITLNGRDFADIPYTWSTNIRDSGMIIKDGRFHYVSYGGLKNGKFLETITSDFNSYSRAIRDFKLPHDYYQDSGKGYKYQPVWAPEFFKDGENEYVFFSTVYKKRPLYNLTLNKNIDGRLFMMCYVKRNSKGGFSDAVQVTFDNSKAPDDKKPDPELSFIDAQILKHDGRYYMTVKQEGAVKSSEYDRIYIYTTDDIEGTWEYFTRVDAFLPWGSDGNAYEAPCLAYIDGMFYLYADHYYEKITGSRTYDGEIHYAVSRDLKNWSPGGVVNADNQSLRHGSVIKLEDQKAIETITDLFNDNVTVSFDANGGTGNMPEIKLKRNRPSALPDNAFSKKGYSFSGWNTSPDGTGIDYIKVCNPYRNITLYARWTPEKHALFYPKNLR